LGVLDGYRVLDLSIAMSGPFAAMRLGDLGADVIKVEPVTGEWQRHVAAGGATGNRINVSFLSLNRNKRSLAINLKAEEGRQVIYELARTADVFLQNYRPGVAQRLGVDYATIRDLNPRLVYVSISGYVRKVHIWTVQARICYCRACRARCSPPAGTLTPRSRHRCTSWTRLPPTLPSRQP